MESISDKRTNEALFAAVRRCVIVGQKHSNCLPLIIEELSERKAVLLDRILSRNIFAYIYAYSKEELHNKQELLVINKLIQLLTIKKEQNEMYFSINNIGNSFFMY